MIREIRNILLSLAENEYKEFAKTLCPDTKRKILGIRIPILRNLAKEIIKKYDWKKYIENNEIEFLEEVLLQGFIIGYAKIDFCEKLKYIEDFVPKIDSWEITDTFVPTLKIKKENLEQYWKFISKYFDSKEQFEVRFAIISLLDYYITENYIDSVLNILKKIKNEGYYCKMAIAWTLAEIGIKYNGKLMKFLEQNKRNLDRFTYNKTLQKMIESNRIDKEQKNILRTMKIK